MVTAGQGPQLSVRTWRWCTGPCTTPSTRSTAATRATCSRRASLTSDSKEAAAATAAYRVLLSLVPTQQATLDAQYAASLAEIPDGVRKDAPRSRSAGLQQRR